jgi:hypothetical protein
MGNLFMSNTHHTKPAMAAIVSAAQKSVNNNTVHNSVLQNNTNKPDTSSIKQPEIPSEKNIKNALNTAIKTQEEIIKPAIQAQKETPKAISTLQKQATPEKLEKPEKNDTHNNNDKDSIKDSGKVSGKDSGKDFNTHIVAMLCDGIQNIHNQSLDFAEKLRQRREQKEKNLSQIQTLARDNISALSNACLAATQSTLKSKHPIDIIHNQAKAVTHIHHIYTNMLADFSKSSLDMINRNVSSSWFGHTSTKK